MIQSLYIIDRGVCLYSYDFVATTTINQQLLGGFLEALGLFAEETFNTKLQSIEVKNGLKLVFFVDSKEHLTYCGIADARDNDHLLEDLLADIAQQFRTEMAEPLKSDRAKTDDFKPFDTTLPDLLQSKIRARTPKTMLIGVAAGFGLIFGLTIALYFLLLHFNARNLLTVDQSLFAFIILWTVVMAAASFTAGILAGNSQMGWKTGGLLFTFLTIFVAVSLPDIWPYYAGFSFFAAGLFLAMGYIGGLVADRKKLYPFDK